MISSLSEHGRLAAVLVKHAREAFISEAIIASQWKQLELLGAARLVARAG